MQWTSRVIPLLDPTAFSDRAMTKEPQSDFCRLKFLFGVGFILSMLCHTHLFGQEPAAGWAAGKLMDTVLAKKGIGNTFSIDFGSYQSELVHLPIGVFDSGVGGLTVLETLLTYDQHNNVNGQPGADGVPDFQNERFVYLGDQANMPYGNYSAAGKEDYLRELIMKDAIFLLGNRYWPSPNAKSPSFDKPSVKAIVIACNTATAYGLADIRAAVERWKLPVLVVGVVVAGADAFVQELPADGEPSSVAVMATLGTCSSGAYPKAIVRAAGLAGKRNPLVWQQGSLGLAGAIEGNSAFLNNDSTSKGSVAETATATNNAVYQGPAVNNTRAPIDLALAKVYGFDARGLLGEPERPETWRLNSVENYVRYDVASMVEGYRKSGAKQPLSKVILGCTHFPYEASRISQSLSRLRDYRDDEGQHPYRDLIAEQVTLIDPGQLTARQLYRQLFIKRQLVRGESKRAPYVERIFLSVPAPDLAKSALAADGGLTSEFKYGRLAGKPEQEETHYVPLTIELLPESLIDLLKNHCSNIWKAVPAK
jgi:glutamate racemase